MKNGTNNGTLYNTTKAIEILTYTYGYRYQSVKKVVASLLDGRTFATDKDIVECSRQLRIEEEYGGNKNREEMREYWINERYAYGARYAA